MWFGSVVRGFGGRGVRNRVFVVGVEVVILELGSLALKSYYRNSRVVRGVFWLYI